MDVKTRIDFVELNGKTGKCLYKYVGQVLTKLRALDRTRLKDDKLSCSQLSSLSRRR